MCKGVKTAPGIPRLNTNEDLLQGDGVSDTFTDLGNVAPEKNQVCLRHHVMFLDCLDVFTPCCVHI